MTYCGLAGGFSGRVILGSRALPGTRGTCMRQASPWNVSPTSNWSYTFTTIVKSTNIGMRLTNQEHNQGKSGIWTQSLELGTKPCSELCHLSDRSLKPGRCTSCIHDINTDNGSKTYCLYLGPLINCTLVFPHLIPRMEITTYLDHFRYC